jgi:hypothetical protein
MASEAHVWDFFTADDNILAVPPRGAADDRGPQDAADLAGFHLDVFHAADHLRRGFGVA